MMGGRGTFASGNSVAYRYKTVGKMYGIKVLEGIKGTHGLPEESHSSSAYITLNSDGSARQLRIYNKNHTCCIDIDDSPHQGKRYLHAHDYVNGERQSARDLTPEEYEKYIKYFGGKKK